MTKRDGLINWTLPAEMIERMVRAYIPWPKAFTYWGKKRLTILESRLPESSVYEDSAHDSAMEQSSAAGVPKQSGRVLGMDREEGILVQTGRGPLAITKLQLEGKKPLAWEQFLNGNRDFLEAELGESR